MKTIFGSLSAALAGATAQSIAAAANSGQHFSVDAGIIAASCDVSAKFAWRLCGNLAKGRSEGAVEGVAESQCDVGDRICSVRQQYLRPLNPPLKKISLR